MNDDPAPQPIDLSDPQRTAIDAGHVISCEHVNLEVPDLEAARLFYGEGLGLVADPSRHGSQRGGPQVVWFNIGRQQFHIAQGSPPQRMPPGGMIGLVLPDLAQVKSQLSQVAPLFKGSQFSVKQEAPDRLRVTDPYGVVFIVYESVPGFVGDRGIAYLQTPCFPGTAGPIAQFYASQLGALVRGPAVVRTQPPSSRKGPDIPGAMQDVFNIMTGNTGSSRNRSDGGSVYTTNWSEVALGVPGTRLLFVEDDHLGRSVNDDGVINLYQGWHVCFYISDFSAAYTRLRPLLFNSHPYNDKIHNFKDALNFKQFRFQDVVGFLPEPGQQQSAGSPGQTFDKREAAPPKSLNSDLATALGQGYWHTAAELQQIKSDFGPDGPTAQLGWDLQTSLALGPGNVKGGQSDTQSGNRNANLVQQYLNQQGQLPGYRVVGSTGGQQASPGYRVVTGNEDDDDQQQQAYGRDQHPTAGYRQAQAGSQAGPRPRLLYKLSHEVRSLAHPNFLRPLANRAEDAQSGSTVFSFC